MFFLKINFCLTEEHDKVPVSRTDLLIFWVVYATYDLHPLRFSANRNT